MEENHRKIRAEEGDIASQQDESQDRESAIALEIVGLAEGTFDRFGAAQRLLHTSLFLSLLALVTVTGIYVVQAAVVDDRGPAAFRELGLSSLALIPSGRSTRALELSNPGVDLRFSPWIPVNTLTSTNALYRSEGLAGGTR